MPIQNVITAPPTTQIRVGIEPAHNAFHTLTLLTRARELSGLAEWVYKTWDALTKTEQQDTDLVMYGLNYVVRPPRSFSSFEAYLEYLKAEDPYVLRDRMLEEYEKMECCEMESEEIPISREEALVHADTYLDYLKQRFPEKFIYPEIERRAYTYAVDPPKLQTFVVNYMQSMWDRFLSAEWQRTNPMLEDAVIAFNQLELSQMSKIEAIQLVVGRELEDKHWLTEIEDVTNLVFVPNPHIGPYQSYFQYADTLGMVFGARLPEGVMMDAPDLSRNEILVRLNALADDTRLQILKYIAENGEKRSQEIMEGLDLSQSASSRHLTQLSATGYLIGRRCEGAKCYQLNSDRIRDTLQAIEYFLLVNK